MVSVSDKPGKLFRSAWFVFGRLEKVYRFFRRLSGRAKSRLCPADLLARAPVFCFAATGPRPMNSERSKPVLAADLTNLQQELRELHQRVKTAAGQDRKEAGDGRDGSMVIRGK